MSSVAHGTKGERLMFFGAADIRIEGEITVGNALPVGVMPETVYPDPGQADKPVLWREPLEDLFNFKYLMRNFAPQFWRGAGCREVGAAVKTTVTIYDSVSSFALAAPVAPGQIVGVELDTGEIFPCLVLSCTKDGANYHIVPFAPLPSKTSVGKRAIAYATVVPGLPGVPNTSDVGAVGNSLVYANNSGVQVFAKSDGSGRTIWTSAIGDIVYEPGTLPGFDVTIGASDYVVSREGDDDYDSYAEVDAASPGYADSETVKVSDRAYIMVADYDPEGVDLDLQCVTTATIAPGIGAESYPGIGCAGAVNGSQGAISTRERPTISMSILLDVDKLDDWFDGAEKSVAVIQPSNDPTVPGWAFYAPRCWLIERPETDKSGSLIQMDLQYGAQPAALDGSNGARDHDLNQTFYFGTVWASE